MTPDSRQGDSDKIAYWKDRALKAERAAERLRKEAAERLRGEEDQQGDDPALVEKHRPNFDALARTPLKGVVDPFFNRITRGRSNG
jgi:hypothetical protein